MGELQGEQLHLVHFVKCQQNLTGKMYALYCTFPYLQFLLFTIPHDKSDKIHFVIEFK